MTDVRASTILVPLLLLAACGPKPAPPETQVYNAPDSPSDFSQAFFARGGPPAWSLTVRGTTLSLSQTGQPDLVVQAPGAVIQPAQASWSGKLPDGRALKVTLYASPCDNAAAGTSDPYSAEIGLPDGSILSGCAYRIAKPAKG